MPIWPFWKSGAEPLSPTELREKLVAAAASGSHKKLRAECRRYKDQVGQHVDVIAKMPDDVGKEDSSIDQYAQHLIAVAQCLANECSAPELWNKLSNVSNDNPFVQWTLWFNKLPERMQALEYDALITEARSFIDRAKTLRGTPPRQQEAILHGRLGELLFHSGRIEEAVEPIESALEICLDNGDLEGQIAYLNNLLEAYRYLDDEKTISTAERLLETRQTNGLPTENIEKRLMLLRSGEPLCRIVVVRDGKELELDEITDIGEGRYQFQFRRNRLSLYKSAALTAQGNQLASEGQQSDALEKYHEASEVDPFDPDPVYQRGMCLLEIGAYAQGKEAFAEVERLAPGWFRCRSDYWLADGLDRGTISNEEFLLLRSLDDGGLSPKQAIPLVKSGLERFPEFAPLYLFLGNLSQTDEEAISAYRKGLEMADEPDLRSRLLCALAGRLPVDDPERKQLVAEATALKGSLVAIASAKLMSLQDP